MSSALRRRIEALGLFPWGQSAHLAISPGHKRGFMKQTRRPPRRIRLLSNSESEAQRLLAIQDRWDRAREAIVARAAGDYK